MTSDAMNALRAAGITITVYGENLVARPRAALTDDLRGLIRANKGDLMAELRRPWKPRRGFGGYGPGALAGTRMAAQARGGEDPGPSIGASMARLSEKDLDDMQLRAIQAFGQQAAEGQEDRSDDEIEVIRHAFSIEPPKAMPVMVRCCSCASFLPDGVGDGLGIGRCAVDGEGARPTGRWRVRPALWARGVRKCADFLLLRLGHAT